MLFKHKNNTDVAIEILKKYYIKEKDMFSIKVMWWNVVHEPSCMNITQRFKIKRLELYDNWEVCKR